MNRIKCQQIKDNYYLVTQSNTLVSITKEEFNQYQLTNKRIFNGK
jgi:hypothetical protein